MTANTHPAPCVGCSEGSAQNSLLVTAAMSESEEYKSDGNEEGSRVLQLSDTHLKETWVFIQ